MSFVSEEVLISEENKRLVRRAYEDIRSQGNLDVADEIFARDYIGHDPTAETTEVRGPEGFKEQTARYRAVFPDLRRITSVATKRKLG